jgi:predicted dehydrogenase
MLSEEKPDAVLVCTPNYLHAPLTIQALEAGTHVFCEKPIAINLPDAEAMKQAANRAGKVLYIGFNHRFVGKFSLTKELLERGEFGRVLAARVAAGHNGQTRLPQWFRERSKSGGGTLLDNGVHMIDMLRWLGHGITQVSAQSHPIPPQYGDVEDNAIALFRLGDGGIASLLCSWTWPPRYQFQFHLICEGGAIDLTGDNVVVLRTGEEEPETLDTPDTEIWGAQMRRFLAAVRGEEPPFASADDGIAALEVILDAYESSATGRTIDTRYSS